MRRDCSVACRSLAQVLPTLVMLVFGLASPTLANQPKVGFDLGYVVECRDVTLQAFAMLHPDEKVVEADLRVSVRMEKGEEKEIEQLLFEITSPGERLRVIDFLPRTQIEPEVADTIEVVKTSETIRSLGATVGTSLSMASGNPQTRGAVFTSAFPAGNANATHRNELRETTKKIPPGKVVVASGTLGNEHGLFFKLRRTVAGTFEGIKPFSFRFVVPREWRGDWLVLSCQARGTVKRYFFKSSEEIGSTKALLALHLAGDVAAKRAALMLAQVQQRNLATKSPKDHNDMIDTLVSEARQLQLADSRDSHDGKTAVTCLKPVPSGGMFQFAVGEKSTPNDTGNSLKQSVKRVAHYSASPVRYAHPMSVGDE